VSKAKQRKKLKMDSISNDVGISMANESSNDTMIIKINAATGVLTSPMACDFCDSGIPTTHVCRLPGGNRRLNEDGERICGLATCIMCANGNENRVRCKNHLSEQSFCSPCNEGRETQSKDATSEENHSSYPSYSPDYYEVFTSIKALVFDMNKSNFPGFKIMKIRAENAIKNKSEKTVNDYVKYKKDRWRRDKSLLHQRKVPFRHSQIRKPLQSLTSNTNSNINPPTINPTNNPTCDGNTNGNNVRNKWKRGARMKCCFHKCTYNETTDSRMKRICTIPKNEPDCDSSRVRDVERYISKKK
jgi:hypothetical protein